MGQPLVLAFGHRKGRGKDLAAEYAVEYLQRVGRKVRRDAFAYSLKEGVGREVFGLSKAQLYDQELKEQEDAFWGLTPRYILQRAGTEAMRQVFGDDFWCRTVGRRLYENAGYDVVLSDLRTRTELRYVRLWGGYAIRIDRRRDDIPEDGHSSENDLNGVELCPPTMYTADGLFWDYVIDNNGSPDALRHEIDVVLAACLRVSE